MTSLPILYGLNFGHSSPTCILPYGVMAEINCESNSFSILESGVI
jgi:muramoyltetrapeptide carboxypeptidase LdcA involved in peptidoglycan recycling